MNEPYELGALPTNRRMTTVDERMIAAPLQVIFELAARVEQWPELLGHYRSVRFLDRRHDGGGLVEMSANRPFRGVNWPTSWTSLMRVTPPGGVDAPSIRFRHVRGVTKGMDVEWQFESSPNGGVTHVRIVHVWNGPRWPLIGVTVARGVIGPVFVHAIASRTLAGLAEAAERITETMSRSEVSSG